MQPTPAARGGGGLDTAQHSTMARRFQRFAHCASHPRIATRVDGEVDRSSVVGYVFYTYTFAVAIPAAEYAGFGRRGERSVGDHAAFVSL